MVISSSKLPQILDILCLSYWLVLSKSLMISLWGVCFCGSEKLLNLRNFR